MSKFLLSFRDNKGRRKLKWTSNKMSRDCGYAEVLLLYGRRWDTRTFWIVSGLQMFYTMPCVKIPFYYVLLYCHTLIKTEGSLNLELPIPKQQCESDDLNYPLWTSRTKWVRRRVSNHNHYCSGHRGLKEVKIQSSSSETPVYRLGIQSWNHNQGMDWLLF